jgi:hypothetical protein
LRNLDSRRSVCALRSIPPRWHSTRPIFFPHPPSPIPPHPRQIIYELTLSQGGAAVIPKNNLDEEAAMQGGGKRGRFDGNRGR